MAMPVEAAPFAATPTNDTPAVNEPPKPPTA
jgi:hypothetical protein